MKKFIGIFFVFAMMLSCMTACVENPESETAVYAARTERAGTENSQEITKDGGPRLTVLFAFYSIFTQYSLNDRHYFIKSACSDTFDLSDFVTELVQIYGS